MLTQEDKLPGDSCENESDIWEQISEVLLEDIPEMPLFEEIPELPVLEDTLLFGEIIASSNPDVAAMIKLNRIEAKVDEIYAFLQQMDTK